MCNCRGWGVNSKMMYFIYFFITDLISMKPNRVKYSIRFAITVAFEPDTVRDGFRAAQQGTHVSEKILAIEADMFLR